MPPFGLTANSEDRSFPLGLTWSLEVEGSSTLPCLGEGSGVLSTLVLGVELNSEQMIESLQPVWSSTGAVKFQTQQIETVCSNTLTRTSMKSQQCHSCVSEYL